MKTRPLTATLTIILGMGLVWLLAGGSSAQAQFVCDNSWANALDGNWDNGSSWTSGVPISTDNVCIDLAGTYTVTVNGFKTVNSLTLGNATGVQTLLLQGDQLTSTGMTATNGIISSGNITMTSVDAFRSVEINVTNGTLDNNGNIYVEVGSDGPRTFRANLNNNATGTLNINADTKFSKSNGVHTNNGTVNVAAGKTLDVSILSQVFNQDDGTLNAGTTTFNGLGITFNFNGGDVTGTPVLDESTLNLGAGATDAATFILRQSSNLSGNIKAGQEVVVQGFVNNPANVTAAQGFTNSGKITLTSIDQLRAATIKVTNGILLNYGVIEAAVGTGGTRFIDADLTNDTDGTINIDTDSQLAKFGGVYTNKGDINIAQSAELAINFAFQVFNQDAGTLNAGTTTFKGTGITFNYNGGSITGAPVLDDSTLNLGAGAGAGTIVMTGGGTLSGDVNPGQEILIQGNATSISQVTAAQGFTNFGKITLTSVDAVKFARLNVSNGVLVNEDTFDVEEGTGGLRIVAASWINNGTMNFNADTTLQKNNGSYTNNSDMTIAANTKISVISNGDFTNAAPGGVTGGGALDFSGSSDFFGTGDVLADVTVFSGSSANPGTSFGILNLEELTVNATATLNIGIGGTEPGTEHDQVNITNLGTFNGVLSIAVENSYTPAPCDNFQILTFGSRSGSFSNFNTFNPLALGGGVFLRPIFGPNDLTLIAYTSGTGVNLDPTTVEVTEGGATDTYQVCLDSEPTHEVTITASPDSQVNVSPLSVSFPTSDWDTTRTLTVSAVDDLVIEGPHSGTISHTASSSDPNFDGVPVPSVTANITDNDFPDDDGDGVDDPDDQCPDTPEETPVDEVGCPFPPQTGVGGTVSFLIPQGGDRQARTVREFGPAQLLYLLAGTGTALLVGLILFARFGRKRRLRYH
ncbi:MAG: beta strand repeat-containing protein [Dehalococcoidia bacterium]